MMTTSEARQCGAIARQIRGLLAGIDKLPECFDEVEALELRLDTLKRESRSYEELAQKCASLDAEYQAKRAALEASLGPLRDEIQRLEERKKEVEEQLTALRNKFSD